MDSTLLLAHVLAAAPELAPIWPIAGPLAIIRGGFPIYGAASRCSQLGTAPLLARIFAEPLPGLPKAGLSPAYWLGPW
jgi:hypothetical protein